MQTSRWLPVYFRTRANIIIQNFEKTSPHLIDLTFFIAFSFTINIWFQESFIQTVENLTSLISPLIPWPFIQFVLKELLWLNPGRRICRKTVSFWVLRCWNQGFGHDSNCFVDFSEMGFLVFVWKVYPKVKVRVQREDADQYAYEKTSLQSLKAFEWLSVNDSSSSGNLLILFFIFSSFWISWCLIKLLLVQIYDFLYVAFLVVLSCTMIGFVFCV